MRGAAARPPEGPSVAVVSVDRGVPLEGPRGGIHLRGMVAGFTASGASVRVFAARLAGSAGAPREVVGAPVEELPRGRCPGSLRRRAPLLDLRVDAVAASRAAARRVGAVDLVYERYALFGDAGRRARRLRPGTRWVLEVNAPRTWEAALFAGLPVDAAAVRRETETLRGADAVVVVSEPLRRWVLHRGVRPERVLVLPNAASATAPSSAHGPFRLGYAGTFKRWHRLPESVPALAALQGPLGLDGPPRVELWGDGPERGALVEALRRAGVPCEVRGWGTPDTVRAAMRGWHAAWVPSGGAWPPDLERAEALAARWGERCPDRWFDPLKGAEARAAGLPVWSGNPGDVPVLGPAPPTWVAHASTILATLPKWDGWSLARGSKTRNAPPGARGGPRL